MLLDQSLHLRCHRAVVFGSQLFDDRFCVVADPHIQYIVLHCLVPFVDVSYT